MGVVGEVGCLPICGMERIWEVLLCVMGTEVGTWQVDSFDFG